MSGEEVLTPMLQLGWGREKDERKLYGKDNGDSELDVRSLIVCCIPVDIRFSQPLDPLGAGFSVLEVLNVASVRPPVIAGQSDSTCHQEQLCLKKFQKAYSP